MVSDISFNERRFRMDLNPSEEDVGLFRESMSSEDFGIMLSKYYQVALTLNRFPENTHISIDDLAKQANVHWNTAKKALFFFDTVRLLIPEFTIDKNNKILINNKPRAVEALDKLFFSPEITITTKMLIGKLTSKERGMDVHHIKKILNQDEVKYLTILIQKGLVNSEEGRFYLSPKGMIIGNFGIRKLSELGIPLPWEETEAPQELRLSTRMAKKGGLYEPSGWVYEPSLSWGIKATWKVKPMTSLSYPEQRWL